MPMNACFYICDCDAESKYTGEAPKGKFDCQIRSL